MTQNELLYILTVAQKGSISKAANELYISRAALSRCIQNVESNLNVLLFKRTRQGILLTEAGEAYIYHAKRIMAESLALEREIYNIVHSESVTVHIGATYTLASFMYTSIIPEIKRRFPHILCQIVDGELDDLDCLLSRGTIDFYICNLPEPIIHFSYMPIGKEQFFAAISRETAAANGMDIFGKCNLDDLQTMLYALRIYLTPEYYYDRKLVNQVIQSLNIQFSGIEELHSYLSIFGAVKVGFGFTVAPFTQCQPFFDDSRLLFIPLPPVAFFPESLFAIHPHVTKLSKPAEQVLELCKEVVNNLYLSC